LNQRLKLRDEVLADGVRFHVVSVDILLR